MSKNLTRKGLALGAVVALGSTVIAGTPAFAANEVSLATKVGTTYSLISGETFTLSAFAGSTIPSSSWGSLKTKVTNNSAIAFTAGAAQAGVDTFAGTGAKLATVTSTIVEIDAYVDALTAPTSGTADVTLAVAADVAGNFSVQSFLDANGNDTIDEGEFSSTVRTVTFVKAADVIWTTTLTQPVLAGTTLTANVSATPAINLAQIAATVDLGLASLTAGVYTEPNTTADATTVSTAGAFTTGENATYDSATDSLKFTDTGVAAIAAGNYVAQALFDAAGVTAIAEVGSESIKTVAAGTIVELEAPVVAAGANTKGTAGDIKARAETKTVPVSIQLYTTYTVAGATTNVKAGAGIAAVVTVAEAVDTTTITVGGKTLTSTTTSTTFDATTNADGKLAFDVVSSTGKATDAVTISAVSQGETTTASAVITWIATAANDIIDVKGLGTGAVRSIAKLGSYSIDYAVNDNFGQALADGYRIATTYESKIGTAATKYATVVGGKATLSVTDASTATGNYNVVATLEKLNSTTSNWEAVAVVANAPEATSTVYVATQSAVATIAASAAVVTAATATGATVAGNKALTTSALAAVDTRVNTSATAHGLTGGFALAGTVTDALGTPVSGQTVTITGAGLGFSAGTDVLSVGSITVQANNVGEFAGVAVYSNTAGKKTITMTSGAASKTIDVTFAAAAETAGTVVTLDAPATILPGRTLVVTGTVADKFGNAVATTVAGAGVATLTVVYTGPGLVVGSLPVDTDASGAFSFRVLMGANETGSASVSASYDADGATTTVAAVTVAKTVTIGAAAVAANSAKIATKNGRVYVTVNATAGFKAAVKVGFSQKPAFKTTGSNLVSYYVGAGKRVAVVVTVRGGVVASQAVTVK